MKPLVGDRKQCDQDEEAINLVEYQNMYQANMKVISVANELFDATLKSF